MNKTINVSIRDKIAVANEDALYICGNSDFVIAFDFDDEWEWDEFEHKTARFVYNGTHVDVLFSGNECAVPVISDTYSFTVGVFAGNLRTTTPAYVSAKKSILCESGSPAAPSDDVYNQLMELIQGLGSPDPETIAQAVYKYMEEHHVTMEESDPTVPEWAKKENKPSYTADEVGALPSDTKIPSKTSDLTNDSDFATKKELEAYQPKGDYLTSFTETDPSVPGWAKEATKPVYTAEEVGADPAGTASAHNTATNAHNDIRLMISGLTDRLNALANSDDTTLDQMAEVVAYIKDNRDLIEQVTTGKVSVSDIIDNLDTNVSDMPLSAAQGVALKALIDALQRSFTALQSIVPTKTETWTFTLADGSTVTKAVYVA